MTAPTESGPKSGHEAEIAGGRVIDMQARLKAEKVAALEALPHVVLKKASHIHPEPINWLWPGWLARGKVHLLAGSPGTGKTTLALSIAAVITRRGKLPDGSTAPLGNVIVWSGEDDPADTLVPRLMASGADLERVHFVEGVKREGDTFAFDPAEDVALLREAIEAAGGASLLIVDPLVSAVKGDGHKNNEVRRALQPLADLAQEVDAALLGITHLSKGTQGREPLERVNGSLAFGALARIVILAAKQRNETDDPEAAPKPRLFMKAKSNISPDTGGFEYDLLQEELAEAPGIFTSAVRWGSVLTKSAREMLADAEAEPEPEDGWALKEAKEFLQEELVDGPVAAKTIKASARDAGQAWRTVERAKKELGVVSKRQPEANGWAWGLP